MRPMRRAKIKRAEKADPSAGNGANIGAKNSAKHGAKDDAENPVIAGADFMLSIVEAHHPRKNGNVIKMDSGLKAQQELEKIQGQITRLQGLEGQNAETLRQIKQLHDRVNDLRREISSHLNAWERTELARHPQRPYTLDYVERIFTDWSEIHGDRGFRDDPAIVCGIARFHGDEDCGKVQAADSYFCGHRRRLSRTSCRGARPGRSHRAQPAGDGASGDSD